MSDFYKYTIIAKTGDQGIEDFSTRPSINDDGLVAFVGDFTEGAFGSEGVFVGDGSSGSLKNIAPASNNTTTNFGTRVQIKGLAHFW